MHSAPEVHARHDPPVAQMGVAAGQSGWPRHWIHAPVALQNLLVAEAAAHSVLPLQARQRPVEVLQKGVAPLQFEFCVHATQEPASVPVVAQKARPWTAMHSVLLMQARQAPPAQKGVLPEQWVLSVHDWH